jgi:hypothetical protein
VSFWMRRNRRYLKLTLIVSIEWPGAFFPYPQARLQALLHRSPLAIPSSSWFGSDSSSLFSSLETYLAVTGGIGQILTADRQKRRLALLARRHHQRRRMSSSRKPFRRDSVSGWLWITWTCRFQRKLVSDFWDPMEQARQRPCA